MHLSHFLQRRALVSPVGLPPAQMQTPGLFAQNFVETLFVLNDYSEHPCYAAAAAGRADAGGGTTMEGIHLGGPGSEQVRNSDAKADEVG